MKAERCFSQAVSSSFRSCLAALDLSVSSSSWRPFTAVKNWRPTWHHVTSLLTHWLPDRGARWGGSEGDYRGGVNNSVWLFIWHTLSAQVVPLALVCLLVGCSLVEAESRLEQQPIIREAVEECLPVWSPSDLSREVLLSPFLSVYFISTLNSFLSALFDD